MKRVVTLFLVIVLMLALSVFAFAETVTDTNVTSSGDAYVTAIYTANESFTVTIPARVTIGGDSLCISANTQNIIDGSTVDIKVNPINYTYENGWFAYDEAQNNSIQYNITKSNITIVGNGTIESIPWSDMPISIYLSFTPVSPINRPGTYTDNLKFTITLISAQQ